MGQINTNNYPAVDSLLDADLLIVENAMHGTGTTTPKQLRENAIGTDPLQTTAQTVTSAINEIFEMATDTVVGLELGKMTSFSDGVIVTDIDLHRAPVAGDRILFYHNTAVASPSSLTTYNDGVAVTTTIGDFSLTHPAGLTLMKCVVLGESLRWQTVQDITSGYTAGVGISINGTTINNSAPQLGDDIAYSRIDTVTSGALGYFNADADCLVMDFRTDAEPYNGGYTLRLTTTGASFKYAVLKDKAGNNYAEEIPAGSLVMCKSNVSGTGSEADPVVVTVLEIGNTEMAHDVEVLKDICITEKTATGNPLTLTDALPYPALSLSADIEPIQDLHGQSAPYVGGAGKNKLPMTVSTIKAANTSGTWNGNSYTHNGVTYTIQTDSGNNITGFNIGSGATASGESYLNVNVSLNDIPNGTYILNGCPSNGADDTYKLMVIKSPSPSYADKGNGITVTKDNTVTLYQARIVIANGYTIPSGGLLFKPMLRLSTVTDPAFAPYSNICPISGRTAVAVDDTGRNIWDEQWEVGMISSVNGQNEEGSSTIRSQNYIPVTPSTNYYIRCSQGAVILFYASDKSYITYQNLNNGGAFTTPQNAKYIRFRTYIAYGTTYHNDICINISDASFNGQYVPYAHSSVTIQLGQTVYGGTLNANTGVLTVDRVGVDLGSLDWEYTSSIDRFSAPLTGVKNVSNWNAIYVIDSYYSLNAVTGNSPIDKIIGVYGTNVYVHDTAYNDASALATALNGQTLVYELTTPTTIQLTPEQLTMLKGYNRLSSDGGGDLTLTYKADRLAAIEAALAELQ